MRYIKTSARPGKLAHTCHCRHKSYQHEADTRKCHVDGCPCRCFSCKRHGKECNADNYFTGIVDKRAEHRFSPFVVSDLQTLNVCDDCQLIEREDMRGCRKRVKKCLKAKAVTL